jgi:P27 family predicted phage terminase small subunit
VRGRPTVPNAVKILQGNPGRRPLNSSEPEVALLTKLPQPPKYFARMPIAKKEWRKRVRQLKEMNNLSEADLGMLARLCVFQHEFEVATVKRNKLSPEQAGSMMAINLQNTMTSASKQIKAIEEQFGFSPASRSRIKVENPKQRSLMDLLDDPVRDDAAEPGKIPAEATKWN